MEIHVKANANQNKHLKNMAEHRAHKYKRDLMMEINEEKFMNLKKTGDVEEEK